MNYVKNAGRQCARLNIGCNCSPGLRILLKPGVDLPPDFAATLRGKLTAVVEAQLAPLAEEFEWSLNGFEVEAEQSVIKSADEVAADMEKIRQMFADADAARATSHNSDPNNGTYGTWAVDGIRHYAVVDASSAPEALQKALDSGEVGDWEQPTVRFVRPSPTPSAAPCGEEAKK